VLAIAIERFLRYRAAEVDPEAMREEVEAAIARGGIAAGIRCAEEVPGPVARLWSEGLGLAQLPVPLLRERLEGVASAELARLERHLPHLEVTAQVAPLIGILGTVWGMIIAFDGLAGGLAAGTGIDGEALTRGIGQALITTGAGLVVAIPATIIHHVLRLRVERFVAALEATMRDLVLAVAAGNARRGQRSASAAKSSAPSPTSSPSPAAS
jgi:biopolymer transport protein ExbB